MRSTKCGLLLQMYRGLSVCCPQPWWLQKLLNWSECRFGKWSHVAQGTMYSMASVHQGKGTI